MACEYLAVDLVSGQTSDVFARQILAATGAALLAQASSALEVEARVSGSGDPFVSIKTAFDLSALTIGIVSFDIRFRAEAAAAGRSRESVWVGSVTSEAALWEL